jgi:hypothetical protein
MALDKQALPKAREVRALETKAQSKARDERIKLIGRPLKAASACRNLADDRVCVRDVKEVCNRLEVKPRNED